MKTSDSLEALSDRETYGICSSFLTNQCLNCMPPCQVHNASTSERARLPSALNTFAACAPALAITEFEAAYKRWAQVVADLLVVIPPHPSQLSQLLSLATAVKVP